jgi:hypothetical protein
MLNLSNELIFTCANHDSALIASKNIGEREVVEKTWGWAAGKPTTNYQRIIKPYFPAFKLRKPLRKAVPKAADSADKTGRLLPKMVHPAAARLCRPAMAEIRRVQNRQPFMNTHLAIVRDLNGLETHLLSRIKGQDHVISRVCSVLEPGRLGLQPTGKPLGSLLFLGPTGVGKTELTLEFTRYLFGTESIFRFDMSEFLHLDSVKLFMGDETGSPGRLGKVLSQHQQGVLLFDEIEKSHRLIWDLLLQMLDAARITLADHRAYDLSGFLHRVHEQYWLSAAFASDPSPVHHPRAGCHFRTVWIFPPGTHRAFRREYRVQTALPGHSARNCLACHN